jgi:putative hydrolase of the HAD superfamily
MKINTLLIDIGEVLVHMDRRILVERMQALTGFSEEEIERRLDSFNDIAAYEKGELTTEQFYQRVSDLFQINISLANFKEAWSDIFILSQNQPTLLSPNLFRQLRKLYKMVAISNTNEMHFDYLSQVCSMVNDFDYYVLSYQIGCLKPDEKIYQVALEKAACASSEALLVDDRLENIKGGERLGIRGALFTEENQLRYELGRFGVL